ncbi:hypothetical protein C8Q70DRAFT_954243 [Cubamyces menziesii]|nr:hypothetical protein C8Q70DRAFT_954243 [Cubamyces menziesii]
MDYNSAAWLQAQTIPDLQTVSVHDERSVAGSNDWKDAAASVQGSGGINDFLNDMQVSHTPTPPITQSANPFSHLLLSTSASYNAVSYPNQWISTPPVPLSSYSSLNGATSTSSHSHTQSQGQGQIQGQSQTQGVGPMVIDPVLTTMNGASSSPPPQYQQPSYLQPQNRMQYLYPQASHHAVLSINPTYIHANASQYQQQAQQPQQHSVPHPHSPTQQQQSQQQQQQQFQQQQGTLSPYVLHSPTGMGGHYTGISPSTFYGQPSQPIAGPSSSPSPSSQSIQATPPPAPAVPSNNVSAEQARARLAADVRPLIQPNTFSGGGAIDRLVNILDKYGIADVDAQIRLDIVTRIRDCAGNHYFRAWVDHTSAMDILREWLKLAFVGRSDPQLVETIMPILHIIDRLPLSLEKLKQSKLGKLIMKLTKDPPTPAIKDMALNLEQKWRRMLQEQDGAGRQAETDKAEDLKGKKRKVDPSSKAAPPAKKAAIATPAGPSKAKAVPAKEIKPVVKDAKSDSSFFSSRTKQAKTPMPSFKKNTSSAPALNAPAAVKADPNVAQPSSINPFAEILAQYQGPSATGSSNSTPPPAASGQPTNSMTGLAAGPSTSQTLGKRKKSVTWAPDGQLEQIKLIERAVYDDDGTTGSLSTHNIRDLDRDEGAALHNHLFEEQIEWTEPQPLQMPPEIEIPARGNESQERAAQEEREQSALVVSYASPAQIPDSPAEPPVQIPDEQVDDGVRTMLTGPEADAVFWSDGVPALLVDASRPSTSVAELVGQLAAPPMPDVANPSFASSLTPLAGINPEQLQQITLALSQGGFGALGAQPGPPPPAPMGLSHGGDQAWGGQYNEFDRGYHEANGTGRGGEPPPGPSRRWNEDGWGDRGGHRGRGRGAPPMRGRGRGGDGFRNTKRKPCSFFQAGRCRYGDQCDFSHEPLNYS